MSLSNNHTNQNKNEYIDNKHCIQVGSSEIKQNSSLLSSSNRRSFIITDSIYSEIYIQLKIFIPISIGNICQILPQIINNIFIGHLPNSILLLSGVNLARTFSNVLGTSIAWGINSGLYTLIPNAIGANKYNKLKIYIQRAIYIDFILFIPLTIIQCFSGEIMINLLNEPSNLYDIINIYCRLLLPFIYFNTLNTSIKRIGQSLNYNFELLIIQIICGLISYPLNIFFIYYLNYGYIATAFTLNICTFLQFLFTLILTIKIENGKYKNIFIPIYPINLVLNFKGIKEYLYLSLPGLAQYSLEWWIIEICIVISGYIINSNIALGSSAIIANLTVLIIMISFGNAASITYRVGKYVGAQMINHAKRSAKCGCFIGFILSLIIFIILFISRNHIIYLWTNNEEINNMISNGLIYVIILQQFAISFYQNLGGLYRGIGYQRISAIFVIFSYYLISLPLLIIFLFGFKMNEKSTNNSLIIIWSSLAIGNFIAAVLLVIHLIFYLNWNDVVEAVLKRINDKKKVKEEIIINDIINEKSNNESGNRYSYGSTEDVKQ